MSSSKTFNLNNRFTIPAIGFGTYAATDEEGYKAVSEALQAGYRHIDTAFMYDNEDAVGRAIKDSGIPRSEIFVTTKVWPTMARDPAQSLDRSLKLLGLDYVDLLLMHWPYPLKPDPEDPKSFAGSGIDSDWDFIKTWDLFQELAQSKVRSIGVSNFGIESLKTLLADPRTTTVPAINQFELHPWYPCTDLVKFCQAEQILCEAYSPVARGKSSQEVDAIAKKYNVDPGQILLSWNVQRGVVVLPKSATPSRIRSNLELVTLDADDVARLDALGDIPQRIGTTATQRLYGRDIFND